jgi:predicted DNA-binding protein (MmcQ/YjbR family)
LNVETFRHYCLSKKGVTEEFPFGEDVMVLKVLGKMFALTRIDSFPSINLKCDPEKAVELRESYAAVTEGYHMSKKHWITVQMDGSIPDHKIHSWIDHSYDLVVLALPQKVRQSLVQL